MVEPPKRGPQVRAERFSFLKELTSEEMTNYSPSQIATILEQRENVGVNNMPFLSPALLQSANFLSKVHKAIIKDRVKIDNQRMLSKKWRPSAKSLFDTTRAWVPLEANECRKSLTDFLPSRIISNSRRGRWLRLLTPVPLLRLLASHQRRCTDSICSRAQGLSLLPPKLYRSKLSQPQRCCQRGYPPVCGRWLRFLLDESSASH